MCGGQAVNLSAQVSGKELQPLLMQVEQWKQLEEPEEETQCIIDTPPEHTPLHESVRGTTIHSI